MSSSYDDFFLLEPYWKTLRTKYNLFFSEYSAINNYFFRKKHDYEIIPTTKEPLIFGKFEDGTRFIIPTVLPNHSLILMQTLKELNCSLFPIPDEWLVFFPEDQFHRSFNPNDSDYIYSKEILCSMSGHGLSSRKNLLNQFLNNYQTSVSILSIKNSHEAIEILDEWKRTRVHATDDDYDSCLEALQKWDITNLKGLIAYANSKPVGFAIGDYLNESVAALMFAKSLRDIHGVIPFLYQTFACSVPASIQFINLEQDLGSPGLRQAKKAYHPVDIKKKWRIKPIEQ